MRYLQTFTFLFCSFFYITSQAGESWPAELFVPEKCLQTPVRFNKPTRKYTKPECDMFQSILKKQFSVKPYWDSAKDAPAMTKHGFLSAEEIALLENVRIPHDVGANYVWTFPRQTFFRGFDQESEKYVYANFSQMVPIAVNRAQYRKDPSNISRSIRNGFSSESTLGMVNEDGYFVWRHDPNYELNPDGSLKSGFPKPLETIQRPKICDRKHNIYRANKGLNGSKQFSCSWQNSLRHIRDKDEQRFHCMACNMYFEARGEGTIGMELVAEATLNRVNNYMLNRNTSDGRKYRFIDENNSRGPKGGICDVVFANQQFSWTHDDQSDIVTEASVWDEALAISHIYTSMQRNDDPATQCALGQTTGCTPDWDSPAQILAPNLPCYNYYLSLDYYYKDAHFLQWMSHVYKSKDNGFFKPVCIGKHIFMRDQRKTHGDICPSVGKTETEFLLGSVGEGIDSLYAERRDFFTSCLDYKEPKEFEKNPKTIQSLLCTATSLEDIFKRTAPFASPAPAPRPKTNR